VLPIFSITTVLLCLCETKEAHSKKNSINQSTNACMLKMIGFLYRGRSRRGETAAKKAKIIYFSKLQPRLILGTGLVGPQLLNKDLNPPLLLPVIPILQRMYCWYVFCVYFIHFTLLEASIIKCWSNSIHCPFSLNLVSQFCSGQC